MHNILFLYYDLFYNGKIFYSDMKSLRWHVIKRNDGLSYIDANLNNTRRVKRGNMPPWGNMPHVMFCYDT